MKHQHTRRGQTQNTVVKCLSLLLANGGFTLIEILVVVLIIGILGAIALPQYQRAVLKSRYSGMMPIAKALAEGNEVYYLEHGEYSENPADLLVAGRDKNAGAYPDGTRVLMYDEDGLSYVRVMNDNVPNARYLVYQKHSANFPDTTQCEAADDRANELCQALGGQLIPDGNSSGEAEWTAYLLSGNYGSGDQLIPVNDNSGEGGDEPGAGDEPGDEPGAEPEPQTPQCDENDKPANIAPTTSNPATGTATCVNGQWKYQWTDGKVYDKNYSYWETVCTGDSAYKCAGAEFKGTFNMCDATQENGCADSTFSGQESGCVGHANGCAGSTFTGLNSYCDVDGAYGCANSIFSAEQSHCDGNKANACADSTFSGKNSYCSGNRANACAGSIFSGEQSYCTGYWEAGCAGTTIQAGAYCVADADGGCDGAKYGEDPTGQRTGIGSCSGGYCPNGTPSRGSWNETNGSYDYTWNGGYCDPNAMVTGTCPAGSPKQGGGCWDGEGNQTSC